MSAEARARDTGISGAREGRLSGFRKLLARAVARDLSAIVVPGPDVARAAGLDLEAAGLSLAAGPRQASVLVVMGSAGLPEPLERAAEVAYAQMPRPRAVLTVGSEDIATLAADARCEPDQVSLEAAVGDLRLAFREGAFSERVEKFAAPALETRTIYTCPMHPEVEQDETGQCPKCGMDLVPKESTGGEAGTQHEHGSHEHGSHEHGGSEGHDHREHVREEGAHEASEHAGQGMSAAGEHEYGGHHAGHDHAGHGRGGESEQGHNEQAKHGDHEAHDGGHDHGGHEDMDFMSMIEMTQGTPRSSDGLQMEWVDAPFGPLLPGLPGGLSLSVTLDGDTVAEAQANAQTSDVEGFLCGPASELPGHFSRLDPLSPLSYRLLATLALEDAAGASPVDEERLRRIATLELERAASHAGWLSSFASLLGLYLLGRDAARLELRLRRSLAGSAPDVTNHEALQSAAASFWRSLNRNRLLRSRLSGVGVLESEDTAGIEGPVARAAGHPRDLRAGEPDYAALDFEPVLQDGSGALARLRLRVAEVDQSLRLARTALQTLPNSSLKIESAPSVVHGSGRAGLEMPRGAAKLNLTLDDGEITEARLDLPSKALLPLAATVAEGRELGDALAGVASLDISPWGLG